MLNKIMLMIRGILGSSGAISIQMNGIVSKVIDGDTIKVLVDNKKEYKVRLYGIDTPEKKQPYYEEAKKALEKLILDEVVTITFDRLGFFGRIIGKIYCDTQYINILMVENGHAWHYAKYTNNDPFMQHAQEMAEAEELGLWSLNAPTPPWIQRKAKKHADATQWWLNTDSNTRHNNTCMFYNNSIHGRQCDKKEGNACQICEG